MMLMTARLTLREFRESDVEAIFALDSDPVVVQMRGRLALTREESRQRFEETLLTQSEQPRKCFAFIIEDREQNALLGRCRLEIKGEGMSEAELAYHLSPPAWGHGYASEAASELLRFGFQDLKLHRIVADCYVENRGSMRVLEKLGMQREGRLRQNRRFNVSWEDSFIYSILEHEWAVQSH